MFTQVANAVSIPELPVMNWNFVKSMPGTRKQKIVLIPLKFMQLAMALNLCELSTQYTCIVDQ